MSRLSNRGTRGTVIACLVGVEIYRRVSLWWNGECAMYADVRAWCITGAIIIVRWRGYRVSGISIGQQWRRTRGLVASTLTLLWQLQFCWLTFSARHMATVH
ncbi:hypothetical protein PPTG_24550 [Phytophthora nicotianae INRA-310]|uniref:Uncharacterized protein n=1 Tax=Phytophthora nicotianae (strain INRA-310) TaxID=761204 RepID=W2PFK8_PHYN3|nr:hypothetical protein PPTG_24550 [Phytophthora nicotianae INRA-310]ETM98774.1 hypothetical protein PPTG_24550 [Phytophthora nicotianae INRA-310]